MAAATTYAAIVSALTTLGYTQWNKGLSFRSVPEASADGLFVVAPSSVEPQVRQRAAASGTYLIDTTRRWSIQVLFRVLESSAEVVSGTLLPAEEAIVSALLAITGAVSVAVSYSSDDASGGVMLLILDFETRTDR